MGGSGKRPDRADLQEAALNHLARYATTRVGLERVLDRRIARWAHSAKAGPRDGAAHDRSAETAAIAAAVAAARLEARAVVAGLVAAGAVDDAAFAAARVRRLARSGASRRGIAAHLVRRGIGGPTLAAALEEDPAAELLAALAFARRRRIGPFRTPAPADPERARRELAALARAGFPASIAREALGMPRPEAEERLVAARRDGG